ncbi:MAG: hypothetical protein H7326_05175 [Bdellovibrionaceae bacterium]|nr:hypothetical protein [Pseudobdellovibrionaceae bacterium]
MEKLRLRCPTCSKLYEVIDSDITSTTPQFDCISCATRFTFAYPVINPRDVATQVVFQNPTTPAALTFQQELENQSGRLGTEAEPQGAAQQRVHSCPKCGAVNDKGLAECYSCHVIFERLLELPLDPTLRAQPSLVRKWKNLVLNFDSSELHDDFLKSCHELDALRFAILKYEELQKAQGGKDYVCESMIYKAHGLLQVTLYSKRTGDPFYKKDPPKNVVAWHKYVFFTPLIISILMMLSGFTSLSQRNLVGAGVAVMLLTFGLTLFWKGRLSMSDFIG